MRPSYRYLAAPRRAFTLIELLVVVAIIALLIAILLPSLSEAREQGKRVKCMSNLRAMMQGSYAYFLDYNDRFPFIVRIEGLHGGACSWYYGGKSTSDYWRQGGGVFYFYSDQRPLNEYLLGHEVDDVRDDGIEPDYEVFRGPSDTTSYQRNFYNLAPGNPSQISTYDDIGTSYHFNLVGLYTEDPNPWGGALPEVEGNEGWEDNLREIIRGGGGQGQLYSRYVFFLEDPGDFSMARDLSTIGNHGKFQRHVVGFLDGHADTIRIEAERSAYCGQDYYIRNPAWFWPTVVNGRVERPARHYGFGRRCNRGPAWDFNIDG